ncbi:MAG: DUF3368 domain-containing protein [Leptospiraceae bacterium]|nr:DUF3368 domain-containing protein [Leptospiraceae bacterium]MCP5497646.1 DUF3368 domain-containing protein [Leptospiraceae bacterium]
MSFITSLGVILWNIANKKISSKDGKEYIEKLRNTSLWVSEKVIETALQAIINFEKTL